MAKAPALERGVEGVAGQRPERQLDDVMIEFHRRVLEVVHAVDDQHGNERAGRAHQWPRGGKDQREGDDDGGLRQSVIGRVDAKVAVHDFDEPPRQRRQLVGAERPFPAVGHGLDEIERQIGVEETWQRGPDREMQRQKPAECGLRPTLDPADQSGLGRGGGRRKRRRSGDRLWHLTGAHRFWRYKTGAKA